MVLTLYQSDDFELTLEEVTCNHLIEFNIASSTNQLKL